MNSHALQWFQKLVAVWLAGLACSQSTRSACARQTPLTTPAAVQLQEMHAISDVTRAPLFLLFTCRCIVNWVLNNATKTGYNSLWQETVGSAAGAQLGGRAVIVYKALT